MPDELNINSRSDLRRALVALSELDRARTRGEQTKPDARGVATALGLSVENTVLACRQLADLGWVEQVDAPRRMGDGHDRKVWRLTPAGASELLEA